MAAGMNPSVFAVKEKMVDELEEEFIEKVKLFTFNVKTKMRAMPREAGVQVFEFALVFLTQTLPDLSRLDTAPDVIQDDSKILRKDFEKFKDNIHILSQKLKDAQQSISEKLEEAQQTLSETFSNAQQTLSEKLSEVEQNANFSQERVKINVEKPTKVNRKKLNKLTKTSKITPASTSLASASAAERQSSGPPESLSQISMFSVRAPCDSNEPRIWDMKLLPGGLVVLTDCLNKSVKGYDLQGRLVFDCALCSTPRYITGIDNESPYSWNVCVTLPGESSLAFLMGNIEAVKMRRCVEVSQKITKTSKQYWAIAAIKTQTLAVGCQGGRIDLINHSGTILCKLHSTLDPYRMVATTDECLLMSLYRGSILAKLKLKDGSIIFHHRVEQIEKPAGITFSRDGSCLVVDSYKGTLHLMSPDGVWAKTLWSHPGGEDTADQLLSVSLVEKECVSCTQRGNVFVKYVSY